MFEELSILIHLTFVQGKMGPTGVKGFLGVKGPPVSKQLTDQVITKVII